MEEEGFQELMEEAAKMKNAQLEEKRKEWLKAPEFLKRTLTGKASIASLRSSQTFQERLVFISEHKDQGNAYCQDGEFEEAIGEYVEALSVLLWFWLPGGKHSEEIPLFAGYDAFKSPECCASARRTLVAILLNVAHCLNKVERWDPSIYACTYVLDKLDKHSVKALYRRAVAYYGQGTSFSLDQAVEDLLSANSIDPEDKQVSKLLQKYFKLKVKQDRKDGTIWKRSFARMREHPDPSSEEPSVRGWRPPSRIASIISWSFRTPLVFAVYVGIFGHAMYRIYLILTNPVGPPIDFTERIKSF